MKQSQVKIKELLGTGLSNEVVASAVGCEPSYISQLMSDEVFYEEVVALRAKSLQSASNRDNKIDTLEETILDKLLQLVPALYKTSDLLAAFRITNSARRRGVAAPSSLVLNQRIVNLQLPDAVVKRFETNPYGEVVEVDGQTLVTMQAPTLLKALANQSKDTNSKAYERVSKFLPQSVDNSVTLPEIELDRNGKSKYSGI